MKIAYYSLGNLKRPLGKLHDNKGAPVLSASEMVVQELHEVHCEIRRMLTPALWLRPLSRGVLLNTSAGSLYRTTEGLIYLREPDHRGIMLSRSISMDTATEMALDARSWSRKGYLEGFRVSNREVIRTVRRPGKGLTLMVGSGGRRYRIELHSVLAGEL